MHQLPNNTLFIKKVTREDAGMYVCQAQIRGRPIYNNSSVSVVVNCQFNILSLKLKYFTLLLKP